MTNSLSFRIKLKEDQYEALAITRAILPRFVVDTEPISEGESQRVRNHQSV